MNADERRKSLNAIAERVVGLAFKVSNTLGVSYVRATGLSLCLPVNFGASRIDIQRIVYNF
jgi:hypothetical protein